MGNSISEEERQERLDIVNNIKNLNFEILDIGDKNGATGYLDFIKPSDLKNELSIMKGQDVVGRKFFVFKAIFEFEDKTTFETFTTFFQRYDDSDFTWHTCGHYGKYIMNTEGGTSNDQFKFILELLTNKFVELNKDKEKCEILRLNFSNKEPFKSEEKYPISVRIE